MLCSAGQAGRQGVRGAFRPAYFKAYSCLFNINDKGHEFTSLGLVERAKMKGILLQKYSTRKTNSEQLHRTI